VLLPRVPEQQKREVEQILKESNPQEVVQMILNLEVTLDEMQQQAKLEGKKEGIEVGKKEGKLEEKRNVARLALREGADEDFITKITGLTKEEIQKLKEELN